MVRSDYWKRAKDLIDWCTEDELKVLSQQSSKELNKRIDAYTGKLELKDLKKKQATQRRIKERLTKTAGNKL